MAKSEHDDQSTDRSADRKKRSMAGKSIGGIAIVVLVALYAFARPALNERFGWDLPDVRTDSRGQVVVNDSSAGSQSSKATTPKTDSSTSAKRAPSSTDKGSVAGTSAKRNDSSQTASSQQAATTKSGPLAGRVGASSRDDSTPTGKIAASSDSSAGDEDLLYGLLKEVAKNRYVSPAGLQYTPGSAEGHRLEHLRRHTKDDPGRPGSHGVFDGGMEKALLTIDKAYDRAKKGQRTTKKVDDGRTIYTVDMGGRIGFVGGRDGGRKRNPMARRVRLVLEGTRVITAYPL